MQLGRDGNFDPVRPDPPRPVPPRAALPQSCCRLPPTRFLNKLLPPVRNSESPTKHELESPTARWQRRQRSVGCCGLWLDGTADFGSQLLDLWISCEISCGLCICEFGSLLFSGRGGMRRGGAVRERGGIFDPTTGAGRGRVLMVLVRGGFGSHDPPDPPRCHPNMGVGMGVVKDDLHIPCSTNKCGINITVPMIVPISNFRGRLGSLLHF
uniref:Uncharacterized protein n=1 Tax=Fagus sylvatica TaxID=28930 RepID=A0A2N9GAG8_FAGSY